MEHFSMIESIKKRRSVRTYSGKPLSDEDANRITAFIAGLKPPFNGHVKIILVRGKSSAEPLKLGTYGVIKGASDFLLLIYEEGELSEEAAGYLLEKVVLYCTYLNIGTCWLGGTFSRKQFGDQVNLNNNEKMRIVSPIGYPSHEKRFLDSLMRAGAKSNSRKPFEKLFFDTTFDNPLTEEKAGVYREALEMVRLSPSASNSQPWRVVTDDRYLHFYRRNVSGFSAIDLGIALAHFELSCRELNISGAFKRIDNINKHHEKKPQYVISWEK